MPPTPTYSTRSHSAGRSKARPCELCYRPIDTDHERFCSTCAPKAKGLKRL